MLLQMDIDQPTTGELIWTPVIEFDDPKMERDYAEANVKEGDIIKFEYKNPPTTLMEEQDRLFYDTQIYLNGRFQRFPMIWYKTELMRLLDIYVNRKCVFILCDWLRENKICERAQQELYKHIAAFPRTGTLRYYAYIHNPNNGLKFSDIVYDYFKKR